MLLATLYFTCCLGVVLFQVALILGAPWGEITQGGGQKGALNMRGRVFAAISIFLLLAMGFAILSRAGLWPHWPVWTSWLAIGVQALSAFANWITPSVRERKLWGPITTLMLGLAISASLF